MSFYITTPLYYVNDTPHIGHAYTTVICDVLHRYHQLFGENTFLLTGTDEHGQKVQNAAKKRGVPVEQHVTEYALHFQELWKELAIKESFFMRTTMDFHKKVVQSCLQELWDQQKIYKKDYEGLYCESEEIFYTPKELVDGKTPLGNSVSLIKEANYFFKMSECQDQLIEHIQQNPTFIQPTTRRNEILGFLKQPLGDLSISRPKSRLKWGIEIPFDTEHVTYVWFDALLNYASAVGYRQNDKQELFNKFWPQAIHVIGKDILVTHAVYWPTMLMALKCPIPKQIFAHGWWLTDQNEKMSKSKKNVIKPLDIKEVIGVHGLRYFLTKGTALGNDAKFDADLVIHCINTDLANNLGNLFSRVSKLVEKAFEGKIPCGVHGKEGQPATKQLRQEALQVSKDARRAIEAMAPQKAIEHIMHFLTQTNRYLEQMHPWVLMKENPHQKEDGPVGEILYACIESLRIAGILLYPVMPAKMRDLLQRLGWDATPCFEDAQKWGLLKPHFCIQKGSLLFPRIEAKRL